MLIVYPRNICTLLSAKGLRSNRTRLDSNPKTNISRYIPNKSSLDNESTPLAGTLLYNLKCLHILRCLI